MAMKSSIANHQKAELVISNMVLRSSFLVVMVLSAHSVERSIDSTLTIPEALANVLSNACNADGKNVPISHDVVGLREPADALRVELSSLSLDSYNL